MHSSVPFVFVIRIQICTPQPSTGTRVLQNSSFTCRPLVKFTTNYYREVSVLCSRPSNTNSAGKTHWCNKID